MSMDATRAFPACLTIDDAPSEDTTRKLSALEARGIKAIWFCRGEYLDRRPDVAVAIIQKGHVLGNHSWNHPAFSSMRLSKARAQIQRTEALIDLAYSRAGIPRPARLFRFPWGDKGAGTHLERPPEPAGAERVRALQAMLREFGFVQPAFDGVAFPPYPFYDLAGDADTWFTFDAMEWVLVSRKPRDGIDSLDAVLARIDAHLRAKRHDVEARDRGEVVIVHDFEATARTFTPIVDRLVMNGASFSLPHGMLGHRAGGGGR
ncbi:MAG: polysaccharide deacetylase family protein [Candidatus Lokiarchaeota archaeon]|nr:polysaccharide deacetylase family protein [Candidatus Lokiarchaeota archaeon]